MFWVRNAASYHSFDRSLLDLAWHGSNQSWSLPIISSRISQKLAAAGDS